MSAEHRRPAVAFVVLAIVAAGIVGIQRADAQGGRLLAAVIGAGVSVHGTLPQGEPLAEPVLGDEGLLAGGSFLGLADVTRPAAEPEQDEASVVVRGVVATEAQRSDRRATGPHRRDKADRGRTTRARDDAERRPAATVRQAGSSGKHSSARALAATAPSRAPAAAATPSARTHRAAAAARTVAPPRRPALRQDHGRAHPRAAHRTVHPKSPRGAHRAASRKSFRR